MPNCKAPSSFGSTTLSLGSLGSAHPVIGVIGGKAVLVAVSPGDTMLVNTEVSVMGKKIKQNKRTPPYLLYVIMSEIMDFMQIFGNKKI